MNRKEFISAMKGYGDRQCDLAKAIGICPSRLSEKMNEKKGVSFSQSEMLAIKKRYQLSDEQVEAIFFS